MGFACTSCLLQHWRCCCGYFLFSLRAMGGGQWTGAKKTRNGSDAGLPYFNRSILPSWCHPTVPHLLVPPEFLQTSFFCFASLPYLPHSFALVHNRSTPLPSSLQSTHSHTLHTYKLISFVTFLIHLSVLPTRSSHSSTLSRPPLHLPGLFKEYSLTTPIRCLSSIFHSLTLPTYQQWTTNHHHP